MGIHFCHLNRDPEIFGAYFSLLSSPEWPGARAPLFSEGPSKPETQTFGTANALGDPIEPPHSTTGKLRPKAERLARVTRVRGMAEMSVLEGATDQLTDGEA